MTPRDTTMSILKNLLQGILDWVKSNHAKVGKIREDYQRKLDEERQIAAFKKQMEAKIKAEKQAAEEEAKAMADWKLYKGMK